MFQNLRLLRNRWNEFVTTYPSEEFPPLEQVLASIAQCQSEDALRDTVLKLVSSSAIVHFFFEFRRSIEFEGPPSWKCVRGANVATPPEMSVVSIFENGVPTMWEHEDCCGIFVPVRGSFGTTSLMSIAFASVADWNIDLLSCSQLLMYISAAVHKRIFELKNESSVGLSVREVQCLLHAAMGTRIKDIGPKLGLKGTTVNFYLTRIRAKFGVQNTLFAVLRAVEAGLITSTSGAIRAGGIENDIAA